MKRSRFSEQQIAFILRQAEEGTRVGEACRKAGISVQTYCRWRKKYGGRMPAEMKHLQQLEAADPYGWRQFTPAPSSTRRARPGIS